MRFYKTNRADDPGFEVPVEEVARLYGASKWRATGWPTERAVRAFLTDPDGPIGGRWDN